MRRPEAIPAARGRALPRRAVGPALAEAMYRQLERHFSGVDEERFLADLDGKDWVILLEDAGGRLLGFSTIAMCGERHRGERITVVYSGDTIVDPEAWGTPELPRTWIRTVRGIHRRLGRGPLWWLLISSGFRTYRFLPVFCRDYHPRPGPRRDGRLGEMAEALARRRFGADYDVETGLVRLAHPQRLRPALLHMPEGRRRDPHIAFFLARNPGHADGDELVCLASLEDPNLTRAGLRMLYGTGTAGARARLPLERGRPSDDHTRARVER